MQTVFRSGRLFGTTLVQTNFESFCIWIYTEVGDGQCGWLSLASSSEDDHLIKNLISNHYDHSWRQWPRWSAQSTVIDHWSLCGSRKEAPWDPLQSQVSPDEWWGLARWTKNHWKHWFDWLFCRKNKDIFMIRRQKNLLMNSRWCLTFSFGHQVPIKSFPSLFNFSTLLLKLLNSLLAKHNL